MLTYNQLYDWQKQFIEKYNGYGIIKAFPATGKTDAVLSLIKLKNIYPVIIAVPTKALKQQWEKRIAEYNLNHHVKAIYTFSKASKSNFKDMCNLLVVDECHRATSPKYKQLLSNIYHNQIIGLTATPNEEAIKLFGGVIIDVPFQEAKKYIADFTIYFHLIDLTPKEEALYQYYTDKIRSIYKVYGSHPTKIAEMELKNYILQRRNVVYWAKNRIPKTIEIYKQNPNLTTLIITQRIKQAEEIASHLNIPVFHSDNPDYNILKKFQNNEIKSLISVQMLKEGYDKRDIQRVILTSTFITHTYFIQTLGRAVRLPEDAEIHIILAKGTTDIDLIARYRKMFKCEVVS